MVKSGKRLCAFFLMLVMMICIAGCGTSQGNDTQEQTTQNSTSTETSTDAKTETDSTERESAPSDVQESDDTETTGSDILVVYFSRTGEQYTVGVIDEGNTAIVAKMIADQTGADLFEVLPIDDHYPMTYAELTDVAKQEQNNNARPEYAGEVPDLSQYDTIFIGAPVWWGDWPMIMYTFFETNADMLAGKKLVPFSTHEGSGLSGFDRKLASACPNSQVLEGLAIRGNDCQNKQDSVRSSVNDWLTGLGY
jgi:flavodoxin